MEEEPPKNFSSYFKFSSTEELLEDLRNEYLSGDDSRSADVSQLHEVIIDDTTKKDFLEINSFIEEADKLSSPDDFILEEARSLASEFLKMSLNVTPPVKITISPETPEHLHSMVSSTPKLRRPLQSLKLTGRKDVRMNISSYEEKPTTTHAKALNFEVLQDEENPMKISPATRKALTPSPLLITASSNSSPILKTPLKSLNRSWYLPPTQSKGSKGSAINKSGQILEMESSPIFSRNSKHTPLSSIIVASEYHPLEEVAPTYKCTPKSRRISSAPEDKENIPPK